MWPEPRPCRPVIKGRTEARTKPPGRRRARDRRNVGDGPDAWRSPRSSRRRSFAVRCRTHVTRALKNRRRKFVASVTFLSFKSRERWHDPPCKRTAMRPVHWSAPVVVAPQSAELVTATGGSESAFVPARPLATAWATGPADHRAHWRQREYLRAAGEPAWAYDCAVILSYVRARTSVPCQPRSVPCPGRRLPSLPMPHSNASRLP